MKHIEWKKVLELQDKNNIVIDIRNAEIVNKTKKVNDEVINVNKEEFLSNNISLDKNKKYYIYCNTGNSSQIITSLLINQGYDAYNIIGGFASYLELINN